MTRPKAPRGHKSLRGDAWDEVPVVGPVAGFLQAEELRAQRARHLDRRAGRDVGKPPRLPANPAPKPTTGATILVIGDSHAHPDHPNWRYEWLGRAIVHRKPDVVVDIGDWWDMPSLFLFDKGARGRKQFEGRRYWLDIEAGIDAMERMRHQIDEDNRGVPKRRSYQPSLIRTLGNHEERIARVVEHEPRFQEIIGYHDLMSREFGWQEHPPGEVATTHGVSFVHSLNTHAVYICAKAIRDSAVASRPSAHGHTHRRQIHETAGPGGRILSVNVGAYFDYRHEWLPVAEQHRWWMGLTWLTNVRDGQFDVQFQGLDEVRRRYS